MTDRSRVVKVVCREPSHPKGREALVERIQFVRRAPCCDEELTPGMRAEGATCIDMVGFVAFCRICAGNDWRMVGGGYTVERISAANEHVPKIDVFGSVNNRPNSDLIDQTRERWSMTCGDCGLNADGTRERVEEIFLDSVMSGESRVLLSAVVAKLSS